MTVFALSFTTMLACVLGEMLIVKLSGRQRIPWKDVIFNLNSGHILLWVFRGVEIAAFSFVYMHCSLRWVEQWHPVWQWLFAFLGWDFCFYWMHRLHHRFGLLWLVHVLHHEGEHFNLSLGIRNSWYSSLSAFPFVAGLAVFGVPVEIFVVVSSIHYSVQFYNHNSLVKKSGWLEKIMITPSHHRVHHGTDPRYINKNFGGTLVLWDKLFGTFQPELDGVEMRYGVKGSARTYNPFWANIIPVLRYCKMRLPTLRIDRQFPASDAFIATGGLILFGLVIYYVGYEGRLPSVQQFVLFALIFYATIAMGGISDGKRWGGASWVLVAFLTFPLFIGYYQVRDPWAVLLFSALFLHGLDGARRLRISKAAPLQDSPMPRSGR